MENLPPTIADKITAASNTDVIKMVMDKGKQSVIGAGIGGAIGFTGALIKGGDKFIFSLAGMIIGGLIGYFLNSKTTTA